MVSLDNYENKREQIRLYEKIEELTEQMEKEISMLNKHTVLQDKVYGAMQHKLVEAKNDLMELTSVMYPSTVTRDEYEQAVAEGIFTIAAWENCSEIFTCKDGGYHTCSKKKGHESKHSSEEGICKKETKVIEERA